MVSLTAPTHRRRHTRFVLTPRLPVMVEEWGRRAFLHDLSFGGAYVITKEKLELGSQVKLSIELPPPLASLEVIGTVVHRSEETKERKAGVGLRFHHISDSERAVLATYLRVPSDEQFLHRAPLIAHVFPAETDFQGREAELDLLRGWLLDQDVGVVSIVGMGGAGKTVLLHRLMDEAVSEHPAGVFFWSFYQDTDVDHFLHEALVYFGETRDNLTGLGRVYALTDRLRASGPALMALDGLERVQEEDASGRGAILDPGLKLLMERLSQGAGRATALVTSRFPLLGLDMRKARAIELESLSSAAGASLLRARGVTGSDAELGTLAEAYGRHALTLSLLGSMIHTFHGGDAKALPAPATGLGPSALLGLVLERFSGSLPPAETAILERLSAFRSGSSADVLYDVFLKTSGRGFGEVFNKLRSPLRRVDRPTLEAALHRLANLKLLSAETLGVADGKTAFAFHAAVKDHFYIRLIDSGTATDIHERVREHLQDRPLQVRPVGHDNLVMMEELIHHTLSAGHPEDAFVVYWERVDGYRHLGQMLGDYARGLRIVDWFFSPRAPESPVKGLDPWHAVMLAGDAGHYLEKMGDLERAATCHALGAEASRRAQDWANASIGARNQAKIRILQGRLPIARRLAEQGLETATLGGEARGRMEALVIQGAVDTLLGRTRQARAAFLEAEGLWAKIDSHAEGLVDFESALQVDLLVRVGEHEHAAKVAQGSLRWAKNLGRAQAIARAQLDVAWVALHQGAGDVTRSLIATAREFALASGWQEALCRLTLMRATQCHLDGDLAQAEAELNDGIRISSEQGFHIVHLDLLVRRAALRVEADPSAAARIAEVARDRARDPNIAYAWAEGRALVIRGKALAQLGRTQEATAELQAALQLQERIGSPEQDATKAIVEGLAGR